MFYRMNWLEDNYQVHWLDERYRPIKLLFDESLTKSNLRNKIAKKPPKQSFQIPLETVTFFQFCIYKTELHCEYII